MTVGKVWLVGAGPGDAGLLTLRGKEVLDAADAIVFDRLAGDGILAALPRSAELIDVGKEGGRHPVPQREIENILVREALKGKKVVRLKGGDPFLFGRGGEEIEALLKNDIPFEVVPGVTSATAVPGAAGIPVTHRGASASVHIITAHTKDGGLADTDYGALARLGGTLVFLMGAGSVRDICETLIKNGMAPETPAAAVERGTTARQKRVEATLSTLETESASASLNPPSIIIVGKVAALGGRFDWKKYLPLAGRRILVTRPRGHTERLSRMLRDRGAEVIVFPCISTETIHEPLPPLDGYAWAAFTSVTGVESFFELLRENGRDIRSLRGAKIAAIGRATAEALEERGLRVDFVPDIYDGAHLAEGLAKSADGKKLILFRARDGSPELTDKLKELNADFKETALYRTNYETGRFVPKDIDAALFTSASTVRGLKMACPCLDIKYACCIGKQTALEAERAGLKNIRVAGKATLEDLIKTLEDIQ